jgi:hypothetical protein
MRISTLALSKLDGITINAILLVLSIHFYHNFSTDSIKITCQTDQNQYHPPPHQQPIFEKVPQRQTTCRLI